MEMCNIPTEATEKGMNLSYEVKNEAHFIAFHNHDRVM